MSDDVYDALKSRIIATELTPGQRLALDDLERRMGLSRTPIKEALSRLAGDGLIQIRPRRGTYVSEISERLAKEAFDVRRILETYGAELAAAHATEAQLQRALQMAEEGRRLLAEADRHTVVPAYLDLEAQLHRLIMESAHSDCLLTTRERVFAHVLWARAYYGASECRLEGIQEGHEAIVAALGERNPAALRRAMRGHIHCTQRLLLDTMDQRLSAAILIGMQA